MCITFENEFERGGGKIKEGECSTSATFLGLMMQLSSAIVVLYLFYDGHIDKQIALLTRR